MTDDRFIEWENHIRPDGRTCGYALSPDLDHCTKCGWQRTPDRPTDDACPRCGSPDPAVRYLIGNWPGEPSVRCVNDWHDRPADDPDETIRLTDGSLLDWANLPVHPPTDDDLPFKNVVVLAKFPGDKYAVKWNSDEQCWDVYGDGDPSFT